MSSVAKSGLVFGIYLLLTGVALMFAPQILLPLFGLPVPQEIWVRVFGLLVSVLSIYFFQAVRHELLPFFRATLLARLVFAGGLIILGLISADSRALILFAVVDLAGAAWTWWALRNSKSL